MIYLSHQLLLVLPGEIVQRRDMMIIKLSGVTTTTEFCMVFWVFVLDGSDDCLKV